MLIFWDQRLAFLATPKAGSTAVEVALEPLASLAVQRPPKMKHVDAAGFYRHIHPWLQGMTADQAVDSLGHVAEGVYCARTVLARADALGVDMPITRCVVALLDGAIAPVDAARLLLGRDAKNEHA